MAESTGTSSSSGTESDSSSSDSDIDDFRTGSRHGKRSKYVREVENKKTKFSRSKTRKTYRRKSGRKDRHASKGDEKNEPVYTALVRKDSSDSFIPFMFSLKSVNAFDLFKTKVLNACSTSRTNAQLYYNHSECKVTLNSATWESFVFFLKSRQDCTVTLQVETVSSAASAALQTRGLFSSQLPGPTTVSNAPQQNVKNMLDMIIEKDWSGVFIQGLPKKSREDAMRELIRRNLKETWCKTYSVSHSTKAVVAPCPEGQQLAGQVRKLLTSCELSRFFDKRAAVRKVFGSADLLLNPLCVQCPICAAVVALGQGLGKILRNSQNICTNKMYLLARKTIETSHFRQLAIFVSNKRMKKTLPENKPTQWEIGQPSDVFSKNPVKIKIPLGLLQRGVLIRTENLNKCHRASVHNGISKTNPNGSE